MFKSILTTANVFHFIIHTPVRFISFEFHRYDALRRFKLILVFVFSLFSFQALPEFANIRQCGVSSIKCMYNMSIIMSTPELPDALLSSHINDTCDCLPNCQETVRQIFTPKKLQICNSKVSELGQKRKFRWLLVDFLRFINPKDSMFTLFQFLLNCMRTGVQCTCNFYESRKIAIELADKCHN